MRTIGRRQWLHVPRSSQPTAAPRCACLKLLGDGGQRHRPPSTRAYLVARVGAVAGLYSTVENTRSRAVLGPVQAIALSHRRGTPHDLVAVSQCHLGRPYFVRPWGAPPGCTDRPMVPDRGRKEKWPSADPKSDDHRRPSGLMSSPLAQAQAAQPENHGTGLLAPAATLAARLIWSNTLRKCHWTVHVLAQMAGLDGHEELAPADEGWTAGPESCARP